MSKLDSESVWGRQLKICRRGDLAALFFSCEEKFLGADFLAAAAGVPRRIILTMLKLADIIRKTVRSYVGRRLKEAIHMKGRLAAAPLFSPARVLSC